MTTKAVNRLIDKYLAGETTPDEERQLALEVNRPDAPAEWQAIGEMLGELTLGEAIYEHTLARRRRRNWNLYMGWSAAACIAFLLVSGYFEHQQFKKEQADELARTTAVAVETLIPEPQLQRAESTPTPIVAYTPVVKKKRAIPLPSSTEEMKEDMANTPDGTPRPLREGSGEGLSPTEADFAQVEQDYQQWHLRQTILNEKVELEIATQQLTKKYEAYLAENKNNIEI